MQIMPQSGSVFSANQHLDKVFEDKCSGSDTNRPSLQAMLSHVRDGDTVLVEAGTDATLLFGHADPIGEPMVSHGPFVMNTREEIGMAIQDYQAGKFNGTGPLAGVGA